MDLVVGFLLTLGKHDSVWVIVDRFTKSKYFLPIKASFNEEQLANIYIREIIRLHGVPISIVSDRHT